MGIMKFQTIKIVYNAKTIVKNVYLKMIAYLAKQDIFYMKINNVILLSS